MIWWLLALACVVLAFALPIAPELSALFMIGALASAITAVRDES